MAESQARIYTIFCIVAGDDTPFPIDIESNKTVGHLKKAIKKEKENKLTGIDADELKLYRVDILREELNTLNMKMQSQTDDDVLDPLDLLSEIYPSDPPTKTIHIVVKPPIVQPPAGEFVQYHWVGWKQG